jgi:integrase
MELSSPSTARAPSPSRSATRSRDRKRSRRYRGVYSRVDAAGEKHWMYLVFEEGGRPRWVTCRGLNEVETSRRKEEVQAQIDGRKARQNKQRRRGAQPLDFDETLATTLWMWLEAYSSGRAKRDASAIRTHLAPDLGDFRTRELDADDIARWIREMGEKPRDTGRPGYSDSTISTYLQPLRLALKHAKRRGLISANPYEDLEPYERPHPQGRHRTLTLKEIEALLAAAPERGRLSIETLVYTGLRISELLGLTWRDIDFDDRELKVAAQDRKGERVSPKTEAGSRSIPLTGYLLRALHARREASNFARPSDLVFGTRRGTVTSSDNWRRDVWRPAAKSAGLNDGVYEKAVPHTLRHTFATAAASAPSMNLPYLQNLLGHSSLSSTKGYLHSVQRDERDEGLLAHLESRLGGKRAPSAVESVET